MLLKVDEMTYLGVASSSRVSLMMRCTTLAGMDPAGNLQASKGARSHLPRAFTFAAGQPVKNILVRLSLG